jgi:lipopolysaccharide transport system permease protein
MSTASEALALRPRRLVAQTRLAEMRAVLLLLRNLTARNLKVKYQRSFLGFLWTLLNPLATTFTLVVVFSAIVRLPVEDYWAFLLSGFFVWNFINMTVSTATHVLPQHAPVIRAAKVPAEAFVLAAIASRLIEFLIELALVVGAIAFFHHGTLPASFALLPALIAAQVLFAVGLVLPIATLGAFYDDVQHSLPIVFMVLFYISPVFYPASLVPESMAGLYALNPLAALLGLYHSVLYEGVMPSYTAVLDMLIVSGVVCVLGCMVFRRYRTTFAEVL